MRCWDTAGGVVASATSSKSSLILKLFHSTSCKYLSCFIPRPANISQVREPQFIGRHGRLMRSCIATQHRVGHLPTTLFIPKSGFENGDIVMSFVKIALGVAALTLLAVSANAHEYRKHGNEISPANQWDYKLAAPFTRDEQDRITP